MQATKLLPEVHFVLIGPIKGEDMAACPNIEHIPWLAQEALAERIAQADLCLAGHFNDTIDKAKRTIPGKAYIYEAMQKPMILGDNPATHERYTAQERAIYFVPMGDPTALAAAISAFFQQP